MTYLYGFIYLIMGFKYNINELMGKKIIEFA